jgi:deazaflavin-dependent oxidoreductase (nitroreductase family)
MNLDKHETKPIRQVGLRRRLGGTFLGVWLIKHLLSPLDRHLYRWTGGRGIGLGRPLAPRLLLTTIGRQSGQERTVPVFYLRDGDRLVVCNVNPGFERANPWTLNLRAHPLARVQMGATSGAYHAREATAAEVAQYWPRLVRIWPAYQAFYERGGERTLFVLEPDRDASILGVLDSSVQATSARGGKAAGALRELQR